MGISKLRVNIGKPPRSPLKMKMIQMFSIGKKLNAKSKIKKTY